MTNYSEAISLYFKMDMVIFENNEFIAVNKPSGLLSVPDRQQSQPSLKDILHKKYGSIYTIHRLDKETSGIILFAKTEESHKYFSTLFESRLIKKFYLGFIHGSLPDKTGHIDSPIMEHPVNKGQMIVHTKGKPSHTTWEVLEDMGKYSLVKFQIHTGRTHQIRVHIKHTGHPILCDPLYGDGQPVFLSALKKNYKLSKEQIEEKPLLNRVALHSFCLHFQDKNGKEFDLKAELPRDMKAFLQQLKKNL